MTVLGEGWGGEKNEPGTKNFSRAASDSSARSVGRKNTVGTESMETMVSISAEQRSSSETMSIFESGGSSGNSVIFIPRGVNAPVLSSAPSTQSWYMEVTMFSWGGGVHKRKFKEVLDTQGTEQQHHVGQVGALDFRDGRLEHLKLEGCLGVHPVAPCIELGGGESVGEMDPNAGGCPFCLSLYPSDAFPDRSPSRMHITRKKLLPSWAGATRPARPLLRIGLANGCDLQGVHADSGIEDLFQSGTLHPH